MNPSIALVANVYNDALALRGLLETGARYFDNIFIVHAGPGGAKSTDGTIELCESFGATIVFDDIQRGFGVVRTRAIRECGCEWAFIMDADERFFPEVPILRCEGTDRYGHPHTMVDPKLTVTVEGSIIEQGAKLKQMIANPVAMAIRTSRRHWFDFTMRKPCENWMTIKDHQLRVVRNSPHIGYETGRVMHERLLDYRTNDCPVFLEQDDITGPFHDHFHMFFRRAQPGKKEANEQNYGRLERGEAMLS